MTDKIDSAEVYQEWFDAIDELCEHKGAIKFARQSLKVARALLTDLEFQMAATVGTSKAAFEDFKEAVEIVDAELEKTVGDIDPSDTKVAIHPRSLDLYERHLLAGFPESAFARKIGFMSEVMLRAAKALGIEGVEEPGSEQAPVLDFLYSSRIYYALRDRAAELAQS